MVWIFYWSCIFDGVDGEIARFRFELSEKGALLDMAASWFNTLLFYGALIFSLVAQGELAPHQGQFLLGGCALLLVALSAYFIQIVKVPHGQGAWGEWERRYQSSLRVPYISALFRKESFAILSVILIIVGATAWVPWGMLAFFSLALAVIVDVELKHRRVVTESVEVTSE